MGILIAMLFLFLGIASTIYLIGGPIITAVVLGVVMGRFGPHQSPTLLVVNISLFALSGVVLTIQIADSYAIWVSTLSAIFYVAICKYYYTIRS